jgi:pimeloyl-ACP methyl ester carboxylesterase
MPGDRIATIWAPTLVVHATDDTLQLYDYAESAATTIPDARLLSFERGGHLLIAAEQAAVRAAIQQHILEHVSEGTPPP